MWQLGQTKSFYMDLGMTLWRGFAGLMVGAGLGIPLGVLMATSARAHAFFDPLVKATYSLPKTALVPLFILWFGIGSMTSIVAVAMSTMLPLIVYTYHGVQGTPNILVWSAQAMGTNARALTWRVRLRSAQHGILTGLRIGLGFSFLIAIAAEMIAAKVGIGKLLFMYGETGSYDYMFAAVAAVVLSAYVADQALLWISNYCLRWQQPLLAGQG